VLPVDERDDLILFLNHQLPLLKLICFA